MRTLICLIVVTTSYFSAICQDMSRCEIYLAGSYIKFGPNDVQSQNTNDNNLFVLGLGIKRYISRRIPICMDYNAVVYSEIETKYVYYNWLNVYGEFLILNYEKFNWHVAIGGSVSDFGISKELVFDKRPFYYLCTGSGVDFRLINNLNLAFSIRNFRPLGMNNERIGLSLLFAGFALKF